MNLPDEIPARGWTPERKALFLEHLAARGNVRASCKRVGLSAEAAYQLRRRDDLFARAWAAALLLAQDACQQELACRAMDGIEEDVWHRGEIVGTRRKYDNRLLLAHLARLDLLAKDRDAQADAGNFDELLAEIAGAELPEESAGEYENLIQACEIVDELLHRPAPPVAKGLPGNPLEAIAKLKSEAEFSVPCTLSTVSSSAMTKASLARVQAQLDTGRRRAPFPAHAHPPRQARI